MRRGSGAHPGATGETGWERAFRQKAAVVEHVVQLGERAVEAQRPRHQPAVGRGVGHEMGVARRKVPALPDRGIEIPARTPWLSGRCSAGRFVLECCRTGRADAAAPVLFLFPRLPLHPA